MKQLASLRSHSAWPLLLKIANANVTVAQIECARAMLQGPGKEDPEYTSEKVDELVLEGVKWIHFIQMLRAVTDGDSKVCYHLDLVQADTSISGTETLQEAGISKDL